MECEDWDRTFQVLSEEVAQVVADFDDNGQFDDAIPYNVLYYPAIGNPVFEAEFGFALPQENIGGMAPFVDRDNDGLYNAQKGDYPVVRGAIANYNFANDNQIEDPSKNHVGVEMNMQSNHWPIKDSTLQNSYDIQLTYQGEETLTDAFVSVWFDADNVCYDNAFIGCLPDSDIAFMFNNFAENPCQDFGLDLEATQTPMIIAEATADGSSMNSFITMYRPQSAAVPPGMFFPEGEHEHYRFMQGTWRDGIPITNGGLGYNPDSTNTSKFLFDHSESADSGPWTGCEEDDGGDKHFLMNFGPMTLEPNQLVDIKLNTYFIYNTNLSCPNEAEILDILETAKNDVFVNTEESQFLEEKVIASPNPFNNEFDLVAPSDIQEVQVYDLQGRKVFHTKGINAKSIRLNTNSWNSGVYTLHVKTDKSMQFVKLVKL